MILVLPQKQEKKKFYVFLAVQGLRQRLWEFYLDQGASSLVKCLIRWDLVLQKVMDIPVSSHR